MPRLDIGDLTHALTLYRPWPWAFTLPENPKRVENRDWAPPHELLGQRFCLHAGAAWSSDAAEDIEFHLGVDLEARRPLMPPKVISHVARLVGYLVSYPSSPRNEGQVIAISEALKAYVRAQAATLWYSGPYGWVVDQVVELPRPISCPGQVKLWQMPISIQHLVRSRLLEETHAHTR